MVNANALPVNVLQQYGISLFGLVQFSALQAVIFTSVTKQEEIYC